MSTVNLALGNISEKWAHPLSILLEMQFYGFIPKIDRVVPLLQLISYIVKNVPENVLIK